jgi:hypothetical protein
MFPECFRGDSPKLLQLIKKWVLDIYKQVKGEYKT